MITLKKLAQELNVSVSTVSKALNDNHEISKETIKRVKELAKLYNYKPNKIAQSLKANETKTIGVIIPSILNRFFAKALFGIEKEARDKGYNIITCMSNELLHKEKECIQLLSNGSVDGFLIAVAEETQKEEDFNHFKALQIADIPIVMFDRVIEKFNCDKVMINDFQAAKEATEKLLSLGRKNIAFVTSIDDLNVGKLRYKGYLNAIDKKAEPLVLIIDSKQDVQSQILKFLLKNKHIDALISADNVSGTMSINVANSLGYKIPENLSVVGFADEQVSNLSVPKLSIINQNAEQIGIRALSLMLDRLNNKTKDFVTEKIPVTFLKQESF